MAIMNENDLRNMPARMLPPQVHTPPQVLAADKQRIRLRCVELAHEGDRVGRSKEELIARAKAFAAFVLGDE